VDDLLKEITQGQPIREKGFAPALADSEVLTMEIVAEYQGIDGRPSHLEILPSALADPISGVEQSFCLCAAGGKPMAVQGTTPATLSGSFRSIYRWSASGGWDSHSPVLFQPCAEMPKFQSRSRLGLLCGKKADLLWVSRSFAH